jgi:hypothetical protein
MSKTKVTTKPRRAKKPANSHTGRPLPEGLIERAAAATGWKPDQKRQNVLDLIEQGERHVLDLMTHLHGPGQSEEHFLFDELTGLACALHCLRNELDIWDGTRRSGLPACDDGEVPS